MTQMKMTWPMDPHTFYADGVTYEPALDEVRLGKQAWNVYRAMGFGWWNTLAELAKMTGCTEASVSARLRDFRKPRFGGHTVDRRRRGDPELGHWEYRLTPSDTKVQGKSE